MTVRLEEPTERVLTQAARREHVTLAVLSGGSAGALHIVERDETSVGREPTNVICISDHGVSSRHALLLRRGNRVLLRDLNSTNGTYVNGSRVIEHVLQDGDRVELGQSTVLGVRFQDQTELEASKKLYDSVVRDSLTGVYNRRFLDERFAAEFAYAVRHKTELSILLMDIDYFKKVNDTYGHLAGDAVLREFGRTLIAQVRTEDIPARYGGEEFAVLARGIDLAHSMQFGERLRRAFERCEVATGGHVLRFTASIGVATLAPGKPVESLERLIAIADAAVYKAKRSGRNRVEAG